MTDGSAGAIDRLSGLQVPDGIELQHYQPTIGSEVHGIDLREELSLQTVAFLRALWLRRKVIFFRDQDLSKEQHIRLGRYFGKLDVFPANSDNSISGYPELLVMPRGADRSQREAFFHQDVPYANPPSDGAVALLRACPEHGGDTLFVDMAAAYENMSLWLKRAVEGLEAEHRFDEGIRYYNTKIDQTLIDQIMVKFPPMIHPIVQTHPETGQKILYVSLAYTQRIVGLPREESFALIKLLSDQARIPEYQCRFRWRTNSIAIWDNRPTQHYACFDYEGDYRELHRVTIVGEKKWPRA